MTHTVDNMIIIMSDVVYEMFTASCYAKLCYAKCLRDVTVTVIPGDGLLYLTVIPGDGLLYLTVIPDCYT